MTISPDGSAAPTIKPITESTDAVVPTTTSAPSPYVKSEPSSVTGNPNPYARGAQAHGAAPVKNEAPRGSGLAQAVHPISSLNPYGQRWTIKARVTNTPSIRTWSKPSGDGKLCSFDFLDESGEIRATCFNAEVDRFFDMVQEGKVMIVLYVSERRWFSHTADSL